MAAALIDSSWHKHDSKLLLNFLCATDNTTIELSSIRASSLSSGCYGDGTVEDAEDDNFIFNLTANDTQLSNDTYDVTTTPMTTLCVTSEALTSASRDNATLRGYNETLSFELSRAHYVTGFKLYLINASDDVIEYWKRNVTSLVVDYEIRSGTGIETTTAWVSLKVKTSCSVLVQRKVPQRRCTRNIYRADNFLKFVFCTEHQSLAASAR